MSSAGRWDVATGKGVAASEASSSVAVAGQLVATVTSEIRMTALSDGRLLATVRLGGGSSAMAVDPGGRVELLGEGAQEMPLCRVGATVFPFEACAERLLGPGMLAQILAGKAAYLEP